MVADLIAPSAEQHIDLLNQIFPALLSAVVSAIVAWFVARFTLRASARSSLENMIDKMIDFGIQHPGLEDDDFAKGYGSTGAGTEACLRYENYCCFVFNLLERAWKYSKGDEEKMDEIIHYREIILRHAAWWNRDSQNRVGYIPAFCHFVNETIRKNTAPARLGA